MSRPHFQPSIYPKFNLLNCVLLLKDGSEGEAWESYKNS